MNIISITLLIMLMLSLPGWSKDLNLFVIQHSKSNNEVQYQLHVNDHCQIVSDHPVDAFWHLREVSPESTAPLSDLEREHSVILTFPIIAVDSAQTPDRVCRYIWHSVARASDCCWLHTTRHRSA